MLIGITIEQSICPSRLIFLSTFNYPLLRSDSLALQDTSFCFSYLGTSPGSDSLHLWSDASRLLEFALNVTNNLASSSPSWTHTQIYWCQNVFLKQRLFVFVLKKTFCVTLLPVIQPLETFLCLQIYTLTAWRYRQMTGHSDRLSKTYLAFFKANPFSCCLWQNQSSDVWCMTF